jgi:protoheme IX farnesyltransferase
LQPQTVLLVGCVTAVAGLIYLALAVNPITSWIGAFSLVSYLFIYTPLKRVTWLNTAIGAVPGALPPVIGWAAARGTLSLEAWILFAIVFFWQMPHVLAISWMYREDYERGGIRVLPVEEPDGRSTAFQIVNYSAALVPVSLLPTIVGLAGRLYLVGAILLGLALLTLAVRFARDRSARRARKMCHSPPER